MGADHVSAAVGLGPLERRVALGIAALVPLFGLIGLSVLFSSEGPTNAAAKVCFVVLIASTVVVGAWWLHNARNNPVMPVWFVVYADVGTAAQLILMSRHELALFGSVLFAVIGLYIAYYVRRLTMLLHAVWVNVIILVLAYLTFGEGHHDVAATFARTAMALIAVNSVVVFRSVIRGQLELANSDPLTGLLNRRGFDLKFERLLGSLPNGTRVALLVVDLDQFKLVNDRHGHAAGDDVLALTAARLRQATKAKSCIARTGGEEFTVATALENETLDDVAEAIRNAVHDASDAIPVTASIGISQLDSRARATPPNDVRAALIRADSAMYYAKRSGGNRVSVSC